MGTNVKKLQTELADREAIRECIYRYCRGIDRCDFDLLRTAYWPEATEDHDPFVGSIDDFIAFSETILRSMDQTQHFVGNILIRIDKSIAYVESYVRAYHRLRSDDATPFDFVTSGRYIDRMECREGEWRILARTVARDWYRKYPDSADWDAEVFGKKFKPGKRNKDDPSYALLKLD